MCRAEVKIKNRAYILTMKREDSIQTILDKAYEMARASGDMVAPSTVEGAKITLRVLKGKK